MEKDIPEEFERSAKKPTKEEMADFRRKLDQCLSIANKFSAIGKAEYFIGMKETFKTFFEAMEALGRKYFADVADAT